MTSAPAALQRVLLVHDYAGTRGGAELVIQELRSALRRRGIDARLMASTADHSDPDSAADYPFRGSTGPLRALRETVNLDAVRVAHRALRAFDPQVVHLGMIQTQVSPAVLPVFRGRVVVWMINEFRPICPKGTRFLPGGHPCHHPVGRACLREGCFRIRGLAPRMIQFALLRRGRRVIDRVIAPSHFLAATLGRHGLSIDEVIPHGVEISPRARHPPNPPVIGFAGRLVPEKGTHVLIEALARLPPHLAAVRLLIAGHGPARGMLEDLARGLGLADRITFLGHLARDEVQARFGTVTVQAVPSLWSEPFGLVTAEAMARGTPVVASAVGASRELIEDGRTGYLVAPGDAAALARRITEVLDDPTGAESVAAAARQTAVTRLTLDRTTDRLIALYTDLLNRPAGRR